MLVSDLAASTWGNHVCAVGSLKVGLLQNIRDIIGGRKDLN